MATGYVIFKESTGILGDDLVEAVAIALTDKVAEAEVQRSAEAYAESLRQEGYDPKVETFIDEGEDDLIIVVTIGDEVVNFFMEEVPLAS